MTHATESQAEVARSWSGSVRFLRRRLLHAAIQSFDWVSVTPLTCKTQYRLDAFTARSATYNHRGYDFVQRIQRTAKLLWFEHKFLYETVKTYSDATIIALYNPVLRDSNTFYFNVCFSSFALLSVKLNRPCQMGQPTFEKKKILIGIGPLDQVNTFILVKSRDVVLP